MSDMNQPTDSGSAPKQRRWLGPAFLASAALNIFLIALIAAPLIFHWRPEEGPEGFSEGPPPGPPGIFRALRELPPEEQKLLRQSMRESFRQMLPLLREAREKRKELAKAMAADPFKPDDVRAVLAKMDEPMDQVRKIGQESLIITLEKMTPDQRKHFAEKIGEEHHLRWRRDDDDRDAPPGPPHGDGYR